MVVAMNDLADAIDLANEIGLTATARRLSIGDPASLQFAETVLDSCLVLMHDAGERQEKYKRLSRLIRAAIRRQARR